MKEQIFDIIETISGTDEFREDLDMDLFEEGILDSMRAIMLIVELEGALILVFHHQKWTVKIGIQQIK